jgi:type VI secretion system protein ImpM
MQIDAGWYGKLPTLGDFATRRLPPAFVEPWDAWLAQGLADWKAAGEGWLDGYLAGPVWRFVAAPGVLAPANVARAWAGVLLPSQDRVGRHFPFTLALPVSPPSANAPLLLHWLQHAAGLAREALELEWSAEQVDTALHELSETTVTPAGEAEVHDELLRIVAASIAATGHVLWWRTMDDGGVELQRSLGLPKGAAFTRLIGGQTLADAGNDSDHDTDDDTT